ncbi:hypothetical protein [Sphingomonas sp. 3-13AW]|uniref:hypothetical protein n=1 Tax=Sphingomonas sp. 3-13AW TaxID=3050450 RepID=UPI003BB5C724
MLLTSSLLLLLAAAPAVQSSPLITQAKKAVTAELVDPGSAQFRKLRTAKVTIDESQITVVCGEYNSKNKFGGYVGFATFAYEPTVLGGAVSYSAERKVEFFGDTYKKAEGGDYRVSARILGVCLGIEQ